MNFLKGTLKTLLWVVLLGGIILLVGRFTFYAPGEAHDNTMAPTIWKGDKFLVMTRGEIGRGSIVYCDHPVLPGQVVVGRVIGMPGDTIEIYRGQLKVNDDPLFEEKEGSFTYLDRSSGVQITETKFRRTSIIFGGHAFEMMYPDRDYNIDMRKTKVKNGYFLLGDNRALLLGAADSRNYGEVHPSLCKGRVMLVWKAVKGIGDPDLRRRTFKFLL